jgi:hypothetical protein
MSLYGVELVAATVAVLVIAPWRPGPEALSAVSNNNGVPYSPAKETVEADRRTTVAHPAVETEALETGGDNTVMTLANEVQVLFGPKPRNRRLFRLQPNLR